MLATQLAKIGFQRMKIMTLQMLVFITIKLITKEEKQYGWITDHVCFVTKVAIFIRLHQ